MAVPQNWRLRSVLMLLLRALSELRFANGFDLATAPFARVGPSRRVDGASDLVAVWKEPLRAIAPSFLQLCHMTLFADNNSANAVNA